MKYRTIASNILLDKISRLDLSSMEKMARLDLHTTDGVLDILRFVLLVQTLQYCLSCMCVAESHNQGVYMYLFSQTSNFSSIISLFEIVERCVYKRWSSAMVSGLQRGYIWFFSELNVIIKIQYLTRVSRSVRHLITLLTLSIKGLIGFRFGQATSCVKHRGFRFWSKPLSMIIMQHNIFLVVLC